MNYLEIVIQGYFNENNREHLDKYFFREYKKAEKEHFEVNEFFTGCLKVIESWEKHLEQKVNNRKSQLYLLLGNAKNDTLSYKDIGENTIEQERKRVIEYCEDELKSVRPNGIGSLTFTVHLASLTNGRIAYNMAYNELLQIKLAIDNSFQKAKSINETLPINKTLSEPQTVSAFKSKFDFTKDKLKQKVLELANLDGYEKPSIYLDDLLNNVKCFNDSEFEADFFLKIHYLCRENADQFWNEGHRKDITGWLNKAPIITEVFKTTWDKLAPIEAESKVEQPIFKNNFDNIPTVEIYNHFKAGLVEKGYLTEQELNEYLMAAFELKTKPEILFKLKHTPTKQKI